MPNQGLHLGFGMHGMGLADQFVLLGLGQLAKLAERFRGFCARAMLKPGEGHAKIVP